MNISTALKALPFLLSVAFPATLAAAEISGSIHPSSLLGYAFGAFVVTLTVLMLAADYQTEKPLPVSAGVPAAHAHLPLAA